MDLRFKCGDHVLDVGNSGTSSHEAFPDFELAPDDCPKRVDKRNWLGGHELYDDWFEVSVGECVLAPPPQESCPRTITVVRTDKNEGWSMDLRFKCGTNVVDVDSSTSRAKTVTTDFELTPGDCPVKVNKENWMGYHQNDESFSIRVGNCLAPPPPPPSPPPPDCFRPITVRRGDSNTGWGMDLRFKCGDNVLDVGSSGRPSTEVFPGFQLMPGDCPKRVDKRNWLGSDDHDDWFEVSVGECAMAPPPQAKCRRSITVERGDSNAAWGMDLRFKCGTNVVDVDSSTSSVKTVTPNFELTPGDCPSRVSKHNWLGDEDYDDWFKIRVNECLPPPPPPPPSECRRRITVRRGDKNDGWGMDLRFKCGDRVLDVGNSQGRYKYVNTDFRLSKNSCPSRVDKGNWLDHHTYGDFFDITVGDCV